MLLPVKYVNGIGTASVSDLARSTRQPSTTMLAPALQRKHAARTYGKRYPPVTWGPPVQYVRIPHGEAGTRATLKIMKQVVLGPWGHRNPEVVELARQVVSHVSPGAEKDYRAMVQAIFEFMRTNMNYRLDPAGLEYVPTPWYSLLVSGEDDCDGFSVSAVALGMALGLKGGFRTVKGDGDRPDQWSHVYAVIGIPERGKIVWLTVDGTQKEAFVGWDPPEGKLYGMKTWVIDPRLGDDDWE